MDVASDGKTVYVTDLDNKRVQYFDATGAYLGQWGMNGLGAGQFLHPSSVAAAEDADRAAAEARPRRLRCSW